MDIGENFEFDVLDGVPCLVYNDGDAFASCELTSERVTKIIEYLTKMPALGQTAAKEE